MGTYNLYITDVYIKRLRAFAAAILLLGLAGCGGGGGSGGGSSLDMTGGGDNPSPPTAPPVTPPAAPNDLTIVELEGGQTYGTSGQPIPANNENNIIRLNARLTSTATPRADEVSLRMVIDGRGGNDDFFQLGTGGNIGGIVLREATDIMDSNVDNSLRQDEITARTIALRNIETMVLAGGTITGDIDASGMGTTSSIMIDILSGTLNGDMIGSPQNDILTINTIADITGMLDGGSGDQDTLIFTSGASAADRVEVEMGNGIVKFIHGGGNNPSYEVSNFERYGFTGSVGNDIFRFTGGMIAGITSRTERQIAQENLVDGVNLGAFETIEITDGMVSSDITGSNAAETFILSGGEVVGNVIGGGGADTFMLSAGIVLGGIDGGIDRDTIRAANLISAGLTESALTLEDAGTTRTFDYTAIETFQFSGTDAAFTLSGTANVARINIVAAATDVNAQTAQGVHLKGFNAITLNGGRVGAGGIDASASSEGVIIMLNSGTVSGNVVGGSGDDRFALSGGAVDMVMGGDGADIFTLHSGFSFTGIDGGTDAAVDVLDLVGYDLFASAALSASTLTLTSTLGSADLAVSNIERFSLIGDGSATFTLSGGEVAAIGMGTAATGVNLQAFEAITISSGTVSGNVIGDGGDNTFTLTSGSVRNVMGGDGADIFTLHSGFSFTGIDGGTDAAVDVLDLVGYDLFASAALSASALTLTSTLGSVDLAVSNLERFSLVGDGSATFTLNGATVAAIGIGTTATGVNLQDFDAITISGGTVSGDVIGDGGDNTFTLTSGSVRNVMGGDGADIFTLHSGFSFTGIDGGTDAAVDVLDLVGYDLFASAALSASTLTLTSTLGSADLAVSNIERFSLIGDGSATFTLSGGEVAAIGMGTAATGVNLQAFEAITISSGTVSGNVIGDGGANTFTLTSGAVDMVMGGDGADIFTLHSGFSFTGIDGGTDAAVDVLDLVGYDLFASAALSASALTLTSTLGSVDLAVSNLERFSLIGDGSATFTLNGATVAAIGIGTTATGVNLQDFDAITISGGTVSGDVMGDGGANTFTLTSGTVGMVMGGDGADIFTLHSGFSFTGIDGGTDAAVDVLALVGYGLFARAALSASALTLTSTLGSVDLAVSNIERFSLVGDGSATFTLNGATVAAIGIGTALTGVNLQAFEAITISGGTVSGDVMGDGGANTFTLTSGSVRNVMGGDGADIFTLHSGFSFTGIDGGTDAAVDVLDLVGYDLFASAALSASALTLTSTLGSADLAVSNIERFSLVGDGSATFTLNGATVAAIGMGTAATGVNLQDFDAITIASGTVSGDVMGDGGANTFTLTSGSVRNVMGGDGADIFTLHSGFSFTGIDGGTDAAVDVLDLVGYDLFASAALSASTLTLGSVDLAVSNLERFSLIGDGSATFTLNGATVAAIGIGTALTGVNLQAFEAITISSGTVTGDVMGDGGANTFTLTSGSVRNVMGGDGADIFTLHSGFSFTGIDGGTDAAVDVLALVGYDLFASAALSASALTLTSTLGSVDLAVSNIERFSLVGDGSATFTLNGATVAAIGIGTAATGVNLQAFEAITISSGTVSGNVIGDGGANTFTLTSGSTGMVMGGGGADIFTLHSGFSFTGIDGGTDAAVDVLDLVGFNAVARAALSSSALTLDDVALAVSNLERFSLVGDGSATFTLNGATVAAIGIGTALTGVNLQDFDAITISGGTVSGNVIGDGGANTFTLTSGSTGMVMGGGGADIFTLHSGFSFTGIDGGTDAAVDVLDLVGFNAVARAALSSSALTLDDVALAVSNLERFSLVGDGSATFTLNGATVAAIGIGTALTGVNLQDFDAITISGGTVSGNVMGDDRANTFTINSGSVFGVLSEGGGDTITIMGGTVGFGVLSGSEGDTITISGGRVNGNVFGEGGGDTITISGGTVNGNVFGNDGGDTFTLSSGRISREVYGGSGNDIFVLSTVFSLGGGIDGGIDRDTIRATDLISAEIGGSGLTLEDARNTRTFGYTAIEELNLAGTVGTSNIFTLSGGVVERIAIVADFAGEIASGVNLQAFDEIIISGGMVSGDVVGGSGGDTFTLSGDGRVSGNVDGGSGFGRDTFTIRGGTIDLNVRGGSGGDTFTVSGGTIRGNVEGEFGRDTITLSGDGTVSGNVDGGGEDDIITLSGGTVSIGVDGGSGGDTITLIDGMVGSDVDGGSGDDLIILRDAITINGFISGDGDNNSSIRDVFGLGEGLSVTRVDITSSTAFTLAGVDGNDALNRLRFFERFGLYGGTVGAGGIDASSSIQDVVITIDSGRVEGSVFGGGAGDTFNLLGGRVNGDVSGGNGEDTFIISSDFEIDGTLNGNMGADRLSFASGQSAMNATLTAASLILIGGTFSANTYAVSNLETFNLAGTVGTSDIFTLSGGEVAAIGMGTAATGVNLQDFDAITISGGTVSGNVMGDTRANTFTLNGGTVMFNVIGGDGADTITLSGSAHSNSVGGGRGADTITLSGSARSSSVFGGNDNDTITLRDSATVIGVFGDSGDDTIMINGGRINFNVSGGNGNDTIILNGGTINNDVHGSIGDDTIILTSAAAINGMLNGGNDDDTLGFGEGLSATGVTITSSTGFTLVGAVGNDALSRAINFERFGLYGGSVTGNIDASASIQSVVITINSGMVDDDVIGGSGDDTITIGSNSSTGSNVTVGNVEGGAGDDTIILGLVGTDGIIGTLDGGRSEGDGDVVRVISGVTVDSAHFYRKILTLILNGISRDFTLENIEDVDIAGLTTPQDYTLGTPDPFFMPDTLNGWGGGDIRDATRRAYSDGFEIFGNRIVGSGSTPSRTQPVVLGLAPRDVRTAWRDGWTGKGSHVLVAAEQFDNIGDTPSDFGTRPNSHGYAVMLSVLTAAPQVTLYGINRDVIITNPERLLGDVGVRPVTPVAGTNLDDVEFDVINLSLGGRKITDPVRLENEINSRLPIYSAHFHDGSSDWLSPTNVQNAVITKSAGNEWGVDSSLIPFNATLMRNADIAERILIVGALDGYYDQPDGAEMAGYSNRAGSDPAFQARFVVANGNSPLAETAEISGTGSDGMTRSQELTTTFQGTSFAAPRVGGYVALLRQKFPKLTGKFSAEIILDTATYEGLACNSQPGGCAVNRYGQGRVDIGRALAPIGSMR